MGIYEELRRTGLTRKPRPCGRLSKNRKPCERYTEPYDPWCMIHCSEEEREFGVLMRRVYREGYDQGQEDRALQAYHDEWSLRDKLETLRCQIDPQPRP